MDQKSYIYYPGLAIAIVILILNLTHLTNINNIWILVSLVFGWFGISPANNVHSVVVWFPLIRKFLKK